MIGHQLALIKRELWEHRSIFITPVAIAIIVTLATVATLMFASGFAEMLDIALFGASNVAGDAERKGALTAFFLSSSWLFMFAVAILTVFYCLDSLYAERRDKSILFWRSLPITDAEAVISKLLTALVVIPLITVAAIAITHFVNLIIISIWVGIKGGDVGHLVWSSVPILDNWAAALIVALAAALWMSPYIGWFLLVSAYAKRAPLLLAFMPMIVIPLVEFIFFRTSYFADAVFSSRGEIPLIRTVDFELLFDEDNMHVTEEMVTLLGYLDIGRFVTSPAVWSGLIVCGLFTFGAIYVRRFRDES